MNTSITPYWPVLGTLLLALATARLILRFAPEPAATPGRLPALDGLRGYLALGVFLAHGATWYVYMHAGEWRAPPSQLYHHLSSSGVALFFMITAFLFSQKILEQERRPIVWKHLLLSRVFRLTPLYLACLLLLVLMAFYAAGFERREAWGVLLQRLGYWLLFTIPGTPPVNGLGDAVLMMVGVWSLPYEWMFYAALPALSWLLLRRTHWLWLLASVALAGLIVRSMPGFDAVHLRSFAGGVVAALIFRLEPLRAHLAREKSYTGALALGLAAAAVALYPDIYSWPPQLMMSAAFAIVACGNPLYGMLSSPLSRLLGDISYGIYLLHSLWLYGVFQFVVRRHFTGLTPMMHWEIVLGIVPLLVLSAYAALRLIEAPGIAWGKALRR